MAVIYVDSFEHYTDFTQKGWAVDEPVTYVISDTAQARTGSRSLKIGAEHFGMMRWLPASYASVAVGLGWRWDAYNEDPINFLQLWDGSSKQVELVVNETGHLYVTRNGTTILGPTASPLSVDTWYYIEMAVTISDTVGTVEVRVNGSSVLSGSGLDTKNTANASVNRLRLGPGPEGTATMPGMWLDDLVVTDGALPGICKVAACAPNGNGTSSDFDGSDGNSVDNYALVDDTTPGDSDFVSSSTPGDRDLYAVADIPTDASVVAVQAVARLGKTDAGPRSARITTRRAATNYDSDSFVLKDNLPYELNLWDEDPSTSAAWTAGNFNGAEFGVKVE